MEDGVRELIESIWMFSNFQLGEVYYDLVCATADRSHKTMKDTQMISDKVPYTFRETSYIHKRLGDWWQR